MSPRARSGPLPADRVRELLARPGGGWVPPPEPGDAVAQEPVVEAPVVEALVVGEPVPDDPAPVGQGDGPLAGDPPWAPDQQPVPDAAGSVNGPAASARSWAADRLPVAVRTGRLDPGRRGAVALVLAALLAAVVAGGVVLRGRPQEVLVPQVLSSGAPLPGTSAAPDPAGQVVVSVAGKVQRPGLVRLPAGSRVDDALRAAGGPVAGASTGLLNLARRLVDGEQVLVGVEPPPGTAVAGGSAGGGTAGGLLDLNTATAADFDSLPGIGPVLAQRIVDWRTEHERFASVDQLREVTGIGEAKFEDLRAEVTV